MIMELKNGLCYLRTDLLTLLKTGVSHDLINHDDIINYSIDLIILTFK